MNMISTNLHAWPFILEAQKKGAKIVVIDPVRTRTAKQADWHVAIKPGTDGALALGMMNVIIAEGLVDQDYVEKYTLGFEELKERAAHYPPERVAEITGIPAADIQQAGARIRHRPSRPRSARAWPSSAAAAAARRSAPITCLPALVGAWRHVGGGTAEMPIWEFPTRFDRICRPDLIQPGTRVINELDLGPRSTGEMPLDPPIKSLFVLQLQSGIAGAGAGQDRTGAAARGPVHGRQRTVHHRHRALRRHHAAVARCRASSTT